MPPAPKDFKPGVPDWSTVHEPTGKLFTPITDKSEWSKFQFSADQVNKFWEDGFLLNVPLLSEEDCDRILTDYRYFTGEDKHDGMDMLYEYHSNQSGDANNVLMHCLGHWRMTELFHDLAFLPQVVVPGSQLLVQNKMMPLRFWHDQLFAKPAKHGGVVAWHQDFSYWTRTTPMMHLTRKVVGAMVGAKNPLGALVDSGYGFFTEEVHIALDDQTEENGGLYYVPGSHRWTRDGKPLPVTDFTFADMESIQTILTEEEKQQFKPVCGKLRKGHASFHHALAVHGSYGNRSDGPRRAAVLNYFGDGVKSSTNEELLKGIVVPQGEKMGGQFFPLVFDPAWMS